MAESESIVNKRAIQFKTCVKNEMLCPAILPFAQELVNEMILMTNNQEERIDTISGDAFRNVYRMEVDRIKYLLASYLRVRLKKLQALSFQVFFYF